jgi:DNA invertase Pin-like site-specific DNA recombinase
MKTAVYVRVSSKGQNYESQWDAVRRALPAGVEPVVYREKMSAKTTDRPELQRLLSDCRAGGIGALFIFRLDRLTRTGVGDTFRVVDDLARLGVALHSVSDNVHVLPGKDDLTTTVMLFALSLAAKLELVAKNERIAAARVVAEAKGTAWGRPSRITPADRARIRAMHAEGRTVREIAMATKTPRSTVQRALARAA